VKNQDSFVKLLCRLQSLLQKKVCKE